MDINILAIIQAIAFFAYVIFLVKKLGIIHSISQSFYELQPHKLSHLFIWFAAGVGLPMWFFGVNGMMVDPAQTIFVLSGFFMVGLGIASTFRASKMVAMIHYACTVLAILFAYFGIYLQYHDWYFWWMLLAGAVGCGIIALALPKHKIWWVELFIFTLLITRLILHNSI